MKNKSLRWLGAVAAALTFAQPALAANDYPSRPIEWVIPYPAGGGTDIVGRVLAETMGKTLDQSIIVVNKPGAATAIGASFTARAEPDGYVIMSADTATLAANPALYSRLTYNPAEDFTDIGLTVRFPLILVVNNDVPVNNVQEFIEWAKQQEGGVDFGTPGAGSPHHLAAELFRIQTGLDLVHIPYKGAAPATQDVLGGQLPFMFLDTAAATPLIESKMLRPLGVASPERLATFPDLPTLQEQGLENFEAYAWQGVVGPKGMSEDVVARLNQELQAALVEPGLVKRFQEMGLEITPSTPAEMTEYSTAEREKWAKVIKEVGIRLD